jgi:nitric oxide reductase NorQ protein
MPAKPRKKSSARETSTGSSSSRTISPTPQKEFVETPGVFDILHRALSYLKAGYPVHFRGPTGVGKTTLALHLAHLLKKPVVLIHGDESFSTEDLGGSESGYHHRKVIDEFVRGVSKTDESLATTFSEHKLMYAVREGCTLLYDEFSRSRPEANNIFLPILQEGVLTIPVQKGQCKGTIKVHKNFRAIFTSNPEEYAGVHKTQDALLDRMVTFDLGHYDFETEILITAKKSSLFWQEAQCIVDIARGLRGSSLCSPHLPTVRACVMVARTVQQYRSASITRDCDIFRQICHDVFIAEMARGESRNNRKAITIQLDRMINQYCPWDKKLSQRLVEKVKRMRNSS